MINLSTSQQKLVSDDPVYEFKVAHEEWEFEAIHQLNYKMLDLILNYLLFIQGKKY